MESYQASDIAAQEQTIKPIKAAAIVGGSLLGGSSLLGRAMPLLSRFISQSTAIKALSKLSPKMEKFIKNGMAAGYSFDEIKKFIENEHEKENEPKQPKNAQEAMTMNIARAKTRQEPSELSRKSLQKQFQEAQQGQQQTGEGKAALLRTMQEITETLRRMRGNG